MTTPDFVELDGRLREQLTLDTTNIMSLAPIIRRMLVERAEAADALASLSARVRELEADRDDAVDWHHQAERENERLRAVLKASDDLIKETQGILESHLYPDSTQDADQTVNALLELLDGPKQREVQRHTREALARSKEQLI